LSRDRVTFVLQLTGRPRNPFNLTWVAEFLGGGVDTVCVSMVGQSTLFLVPPATVSLSAPLTRSGNCGDRFDVDRSHLRVLSNGLIVYDAVFAPLPFHFEP
jgi:hypothetical protein